MKFLKIDKVFVLSILGLNLLGLLTLYGHSTNIFIKQVCFSVAGWIIFFLISCIHYKYLERYAMLIYIVSIISLILVLFSESIRGMHGWFSLGFINIQPAEFAKIAFIIMLSRYLSYIKRPLFYFSDLIIPSIILFIPVVLILKQPDLGTATVYIIPFLTLLYIKGIRLLFLLCLCGYILLVVIFSITSIYIEVKYKSDLLQYMPLQKLFFIISIFILFSFLITKILQVNINLIYITAMTLGVIFCSYSSGVVLSCLLKPYQKSRLVTFIAPDLDPLGAGYSIRQSKIAIGSGRLLGKGIFDSSQDRGGFVPQAHTDFAFCGLAERFGLIGVSIFFLLFGVILHRSIRIGQLARGNFATLLCGGLVSLFAGEVLLNLCVELGLVPTTGLALPLISYGGSSILKTFIGFAIVLSIFRYRNEC